MFSGGVTLYPSNGKCHAADSESIIHSCNRLMIASKADMENVILCCRAVSIVLLLTYQNLTEPKRLVCGHVGEPWKTKIMALASLANAQLS